MATEIFAAENALNECFRKISAELREFIEGDRARKMYKDSPKKAITLIIEVTEHAAEKTFIVSAKTADGKIIHGRHSDSIFGAWIDLNVELDMSIVAPSDMPHIRKSKSNAERLKDLFKRIPRVLCD